MKTDSNQQYQHHQHPILTDLNGNTLTLIGTSSTKSTAFINMPYEAENEPSDQRQIPAVQDIGDDNLSHASRVSVSSLSSLLSTASDVENVTRRSRCPNRNGWSMNRMSSSEARMPRTPNVNNMRHGSAMGRNTRNSSIGSHYSNESTRTRNGQRNSRRLHENRMPRSQSRRRQSHHIEGQNSTIHFQRPNTSFQPSNMPPPLISDMNARNGLRMPPLFNMPPRRNSWSEPYDPNLQNNTGHEHAMNNPVASEFRRGGRRFGVSNEYEQLCINSGVDKIWNWNSGHHDRFSNDITDQHRQDRSNTDRNIHHRGRMRDNINSQSNPLPSNETSQTQNIPENNRNSTSFPVANSSIHPTASRRPPLPPPPPPPNLRSDNGNYKHTGSTSARNGFLEASNGQSVSVNGATSQPVARAASNSGVETIQFGFDKFPSTSTANEVSYAQTPSAEAISSPANTGSGEQDGARGGQDNVNRGERMSADYSPISSSESSSVYGEKSSNEQKEKTNKKKKGKGRRQEDRTRLPPDFDNEIQEEMARAQQMAIPVNLNKKNGKDLSNLNPEANTFAPTLHDANGNRFKMVSDKGICYFVPQDPHPAPNPNYMVSTVGDRHSNDETAQQNVEQLHTDHMFQAFQAVSLNEHHQNDHIEPTHQIAPSLTTTPYGEQFASRLALTPTENYGHNAYPIPQTQGYLNPIHNPQSISHNIEFPNVHRPIMNSPSFDALPTYPSDPCVHQHISAYPSFVMNGERPMVPMSYSPVVGTPKMVSPVQNFDHSAQIQHPVQFQHPYPSLVAVPNQTPSPLVGFHPLTPVFFNSVSTTPGTPMSDPIGTPDSLNSPHAQRHFDFGQPEMHPVKLPQPPIFNFQAYWATTQGNPSNIFFPIEEPKENSHCHLYNDRPTLLRSLPTEDNGNELARKVITQIVNLVKCTERKSEEPLSDSDLIDQLFNKSTRVPLFDQTTPAIVEIGGNDQERNSNDQGSKEREEEEVKDDSGSAEESPDCAEIGALGGCEQNAEEPNSSSQGKGT